MDDWTDTKNVKCEDCGKITTLPKKKKVLLCLRCGGSNFMEVDHDEIEEEEAVVFA